MNLGRNRAIESASPGSVSRQLFDQGQAVVDEARARVEAAERSMELYRLSYEFTKVVSPIDGQSSRYYKTLGNLVNQDQTLLTTVVSVDPMHVFFEIDEPTLLRYLKGINEARLQTPNNVTPMPVSMGLQGGDRVPASRDHQFCEQPEQSHDRHDPGAWNLPEPPAQGRPPIAVAWYVRENSPADRGTHQAL